MSRSSLSIILLLMFVAVVPTACRDAKAVRIGNNLADSFFALFSSSRINGDLAAIEITVEGQTRRFAGAEELDALRCSVTEWRVQSFNNEIADKYAWKRHAVGSVKTISKEGSISFPLYRANERDDLLIIRTYAVGSRGGSLLYLLIPPSAQERFGGLFKKKAGGGWGLW